MVKIIKVKDIVLDICLCREGGYYDPCGQRAGDPCKPRDCFGSDLGDQQTQQQVFWGGTHCWDTIDFDLPYAGTVIAGIWMAEKADCMGGFYNTDLPGSLEYHNCFEGGGSTGDYCGIYAASRNVEASDCLDPSCEEPGVNWGIDDSPDTGE